VSLRRSRAAGCGHCWRDEVRRILFIYALKVSFHYHFAAVARALGVSETGGAMPTAGRSFSRE
jgi:hypothetical protein